MGFVFSVLGVWLFLPQCGSPCNLEWLAQSGGGLASRKGRQKVPDPLSCTLNMYGLGIRDQRFD